MVMLEPEFYSCGRLGIVAGPSGCGKTHAVKEWLRRKREDDGKRIAVIGFLEEYREFLWRRDVAVLSLRDARARELLRHLELNARDAAVLDGSYPCEPGETAAIIRDALGIPARIVVTLQTPENARHEESLQNLLRSVLIDFGLMAEPSLKKRNSLQEVLEYL